MLVKGYRPLQRRGLRSGDLMLSMGMVGEAGCCVLEVSKRVVLKFHTQQQAVM